MHLPVTPSWRLGEVALDDMGPVGRVALFEVPRWRWRHFAARCSADRYTSERCSNDSVRPSAREPWMRKVLSQFATGHSISTSWCRAMIQKQQDGQSVVGVWTVVWFCQLQATAEFITRGTMRAAVGVCQPDRSGVGRSAGRCMWQIVASVVACDGARP